MNARVCLFRAAVLVVGVSLMGGLAATALAQSRATYTITPDTQAKDEPGFQSYRERTRVELRELIKQIKEAEGKTNFQHMQYCRLTYPAERTLDEYRKHLKCLALKQTGVRKPTRGISPFAPEAKQGIEVSGNPASGKQNEVRAISPFKPGERQGISNSEKNQ